MTPQDFEFEAIIAKLSTELHELMRTFTDGEKEYESLVRTGLVRTLVIAVILGHVKVDMVKESLDRLRMGIKDRSLQVSEVINGILAFDKQARRIAFSVDKNGTFRYSSQHNAARELLLSFANSLHR